MRDTKHKYILMVGGSAHDEYGDSYGWSKWSPADCGAETPLLWELTAEEHRLYTCMFSSNSKYYNYHFHQIEIPDEITVATIEADMVVYRQQLAERERKQQAAEAKRKADAEAKRLERERKRLEKDAALRERLFNELKREFEPNEQPPTTVV